MDSGFTEIRRKLDYLREEASQKEDPRNGTLFPDQPDWEKLDDYLYCRRRVVAVPAGFSRDCALLGYQLHAGSRSFGPGDLIFYDTETTGLSTGAGSIVFLVGMGRIEDDSLVVEQVLHGHVAEAWVGRAKGLDL